MSGVPAPAGPKAPSGVTVTERPNGAVWRLRGAAGRPCVNVYLDETRGPLKIDARTTAPPAPRRVTVDARLYSGWFTDPDHLELLARALQAAADWLRNPTPTEPDPQRTFDDLLEASHG